MSNLKDAIKQLTEGTKKRYWPSKNPIDDPTDFPGEKNFEEEEANLRDHELNRFAVKDLSAAINKHIESSTSGAYDPENLWLKWLDQQLHSLQLAAITRPQFLELMKKWKQGSEWGVSDMKQALDKALPGAEELYADNVGPYGSMKGEEEDQGAMNQHDDGYHNDEDPRRQSNLCGSCEGDGCNLCDYSGEYEDEEQDVSRFEYVNIVPERNGKFTVKGYDAFPSHSVLAGQVRKNYLASFDSVEAAQAAFPTAKMSHHMMEPENHFDHLENEESTDCMRCGNTGYTMDDGKVCPACPEGKAAMAQQLAIGVQGGERVENEEDGIIYPDKKPEWSKNSELMPHVGAANKEKATMRHAARMQQSGNKYWSVGSNQNPEENEEEHKDCHQCGNTGLDLGTNKPCDSCPEGDQFKKGPAKTFKQMFPNK